MKAAFVVIVGLLMMMMMVVVDLMVVVQCQQSYVNNKQLDCDKNFTEAWGYVCNGGGGGGGGAAVSSCKSYLTFRSNPVYNSPATIGYLLSAEPTDIFRINNISSDVAAIPSSDTLVVVPINCSCSGQQPQQEGKQYYQHNASYVLKTELETYYSVANNTYQGLTTCQSLKAQNPTLNYRNLQVGNKLTVPIRCACPTSNQSAAGVNYLLTYLVTWGDSIHSIAETFGISDVQTLYDANQISPDNLIFPFTPILVPLNSEPTPTKINTHVNPPPPPPPPDSPVSVPAGQSNSTSKWVFVGIGVGGAFLLLVVLSGFLVCFFRRRRRLLLLLPSQKKEEQPIPPMVKRFASPDYSTLPPEEVRNSQSVSAEGVRYAVEFLTVYKFEELEKATGYFSETNRVKGSLYRGWFKGDEAAVKIMKGDVSSEINILKQINHSNIIRLSGFCVHEGNTYLVYEYAEKGSLRYWVHHNNNSMNKKASSTQLLVVVGGGLGWKQRIQIAYDVADALNYLHNYANPPYIHKNLKTSNILLDGNFRAKIANFGLARTLETPGGGLLQMTRHVVGTYGYMAPEYIENGLVTPKLDVFAFGVVMLELLSAKEPTGDKQHGAEDKEEVLSATINQVLGGENVREKLRAFMDPCLKNEYPLDLAYSVAQLARNCVAHDLNSRPPMSEVLMTLSKILSSSLDWDPSDEFERSTSLTLGR